MQPSLSSICVEQMSQWSASANEAFTFNREQMNSLVGIAIQKCNSLPAAAFCHPGKFVSDSGGCEACEPGKFSDSTGATECKTCGAGKSPLEAQGVCESCPAGKDSQLTVVEDDPCITQAPPCVGQRYKYCQNWNSPQSSAHVHHGLTESECKAVCQSDSACERLQFYAQGPSYAQSLCTSFTNAHCGTITETPECRGGVNKCTQGHHYVKGQPEDSACVACPEGKASTSRGAECVMCPAGKIPSAARDQCTLCPAGKESHPVVSWVDVSCPTCPGAPSYTYCSEQHKPPNLSMSKGTLDECKAACAAESDCERIQFYEDSNARSESHCHVVLAGHCGVLQNYDNPGGNERAHGIKTQSSTTGEIQCKACSKGHFSAGSGQRCGVCEDGKGPTEEQDGCELCAAGKMLNTIEVDKNMPSAAQAGLCRGINPSTGMVEDLSNPIYGAYCVSDPGRCSGSQARCEQDCASMAGCVAAGCISGGACELYTTETSASAISCPEEFKPPGPAHPNYAGEAYGCTGDQGPWADPAVYRCTVFTTVPTVESSECSACPAGQVSSEAGELCGSCEQGKLPSDAQDACELCPAGTELSQGVTQFALVFQSVTTYKFHEICDIKLLTPAGVNVAPQASEITYGVAASTKYPYPDPMVLVNGAGHPESECAALVDSQETAGQRLVTLKFDTPQTITAAEVVSTNSRSVGHDPKIQASTPRGTVWMDLLDVRPGDGLTLSFHPSATPSEIPAGGNSPLDTPSPNTLYYCRACPEGKASVSAGAECAGCDAGKAPTVSCPPPHVH